MKPHGILALIVAPAMLATTAVRALGHEGEHPAQGAASQQAATIPPDDLARMAERGEVLLVDVRSVEEFAEGHLPGAVNLPLEAVSPASLPSAPGKETVLYCRSGRRSAAAAAALSAAGMPLVRQLEGGIVSWQGAGLPTEK